MKILNINENLRAIECTFYVFCMFIQIQCSRFTFNIPPIYIVLYYTYPFSPYVDRDNVGHHQRN